jgi:hypothetical protein
MARVLQLSLPLLGVIRIGDARRMSPVYVRSTARTDRKFKMLVPVVMCHEQSFRMIGVLRRIALPGGAAVLSFK